MGVLGLWTLLDPVGKPVPVESLSHKVLAVDISIWLNQAVRGFRDSQGGGVANAHLLGLYHRVCKLLFYNIKPVFVFDGAPPQLKKDTLARRRMKRSKESKNARLASAKILNNYIQRQAVAQRLNRQTHAVENALKKGTEGLHHLIRGQTGKDKDLFELPALPDNEDNEDTIESEDSDSETDMILESVGLKNVEDVYQVDVESKQFADLPKHLQYEVLNDLKGKRKQNSWATLHEMPREAESFSAFQFERLKRRRKIDAKLDGVKDELGKTQMEVMDSKLFVGDKVGMKKMKTETRRMVSRPDTGIVFLSGLSQGREEDDPGEGSSAGVVKDRVKTEEIRELMSSDEEEQMNKAIALSLSAEGPSQEDIFNMYKKDPVGDITIDDDDVILIPTPSLFSSNRSGGAGQVTIKVEEDCNQDDENVGVMSESSSESDGDFEEVGDIEGQSKSDSEADLFADVFNDKDDVKKLEDIVSSSQNVEEIPKHSKPLQSNPEADKLLARMTKLDKASDIFADISARANKKPSNDPSFNRQVSDELKNGPGVMMKIASKWADAEAKKTVDMEQEDSDVDSPDEATSVFEVEQERLVSEMQQSAKENRLLRLTTGGTDMKVKTVSRSSEVETLKESTAALLTTPSAASQAQEVEDDGKVYSAPAPGFVSVSRDFTKETVIVDDDTDQVNIVPTDDTVEDGLQERELLELQQQLAAEGNTLVAEMSKAERLSNSITDQMYQDCQELLQMFGLPWLVAPGEAEAQCAYLDSIGLTQGTITDDSDIWLFGGSRVYKNFFDQEKYVEFFNGTELVTHFGLNRDKLICLALLTGSDYTDGVETVGPVTAMEILAEFPGDGLQPLLDFKQWSGRVAPDIGMPVGNKTREKLRKLKLPVSFPSDAVRAAYLHPSVDDSGETFSWAVPNLVAVRDFALDRFGWDRAKTDRLLRPVVQSLQSRIKTHQATLENFFTSSRVKLPDKGLVSTSKRVEEAIRKVKGIKSPEKPITKAKAKPKSSKTKPTASTKLPNDSKNKESSDAPQTAKKEDDLSLISRSCGIVIAPSKDDIAVQKLERQKRNEEAKKKAAEIFQKSQKAKQAKIKKKFKRPQRVELEGHGLSESDSD